MTARITVQFGVIGGTAAGFGRVGPRSLIVDRPDGVASGSGLGFNGGELLAAALGGCFWNDLHFAAEAAKLPVRAETVEAQIELAGKPPRVVRAHITTRLAGASADDRRQVFDAACTESTIANSLHPAFLIQFELLNEGTP